MPPSGYVKNAAPKGGKKSVVPTQKGRGVGKRSLTSKRET